MILVFVVLSLLQSEPGEPPATPVDDIEVTLAREGSVVLECTVLRTGRVEACQVISETPEGHGFGEAAINAARRARLTPRSLGARTAGGKVRFTTRFRLQS